MDRSPIVNGRTEFGILHGISFVHGYYVASIGSTYSNSWSDLSAWQLHVTVGVLYAGISHTLLYYYHIHLTSIVTYSVSTHAVNATGPLVQVSNGSTKAHSHTTATLTVTLSVQHSPFGFTTGKLSYTITVAPKVESTVIQLAAPISPERKDA